MKHFILASMLGFLTLPMAWADFTPMNDSNVRSVGGTFNSRFTRGFLIKGENLQGKACLVNHENYSTGRMSSERALTRTDFIFDIFDEGLAQTHFGGSWHTQGGRGGCGSIMVNRPNYFHYRQDGSAGPPCFAHPSKVFYYEGDLYVSKLQGGELLIEMQRDDADYPTQCIIKNPPSPIFK